MAKSPNEAIRELERTVTAQAEAISQLKKTVDDLVALGRANEAKLADLRQENAVVRQRLDDHLKRVEQWDTRRWGLVIAVLIAIFTTALSFASGFAISVLARKP